MTTHERNALIILEVGLKKLKNNSMEKIPYKPGDVLVSDKNSDVIVVDLSQNGYVAFLSYIFPESKKRGISFHTTKKVLDDMGYKLKTSAKWMPENEERYFYLGYKLKTSTERWIPEQGTRYYFIDSTGVIDMDYWEGVKAYSHWRFASKNVFKTQEEAEEAYNKIMNTNEGVV
jgi:hypothetical protein